VAIPTDIAGLQGWYKADALTLNDGDAVATWTDSSGLANDAAQATGANQPLYKTNILNGLPVIRFDGTNDFMSVAGITNNTATRTLFFVAKATVAISVDRAVWALSPTSLVAARNADAQWLYYGNSVDAAVLIGGDATAAFANIACRINSVTSLDMYRDAGTATNLDPEDTFSGAAALTIGASSGGGAGWWPGDIAEMIVFNAALSDANRQAMTDYLYYRWFAPGPDSTNVRDFGQHTIGPF
jgi:hypothetical protein